MLDRNIKNIEPVQPIDLLHTIISTRRWLLCLIVDNNYPVRITSVQAILYMANQSSFFYLEK